MQNFDLLSAVSLKIPPVLITFNLMLKAYSTLDLSVHDFKVRFAMKLTFRTLPYDDDYMKGFGEKITKSGENLTGEMSNGKQWDDDCSWSEWYSAEDPVKGNFVDVGTCRQR